MLHIMGQASLLHMECCADLAIFITPLSIIIFVGYLTILQYYSLKEGGTLGKCHPPLLALLIANNFLDRRSVLPPLGTASANLYDTSTRQIDMMQVSHWPRSMLTWYTRYLRPVASYLAAIFAYLSNANAQIGYDLLLIRLDTFPSITRKDENGFATPTQSPRISVSPL